MKFILCDTNRLQNCINHISNLPLDKGLAVEIYEVKKKRTLSQNDLWHAWIDLMAKESGESPDKMKDDVKRKILGRKEDVDFFTGEITYHDYSTTKLTKEQFSRLMIETQVLAIDYFGLMLPTPDDRG